MLRLFNQHVYFYTVTASEIIKRPLFAYRGKTFIHLRNEGGLKKSASHGPKKRRFSLLNPNKIRDKAGIHKVTLRRLNNSLAEIFMIRHQKENQAACFQ